MESVKEANYSLDEMIEAIIYQAKAKGWSNKQEFVLFKKLPEEQNEFKDAVIQNDKRQAKKEFIDVIYMMAQAVHNIPFKVNYTYANAFDWVWSNNWNTKKKTIDEFGNPVRI